MAEQITYEQFSNAEYDCIATSGDGTRFLMWSAAGGDDGVWVIVSDENKGTIVSQHDTIEEAQAAFAA